MKKLLSIFISLAFIFLFTKTSFAFYDPRTTKNNIYGIHIVNFSDLTDSSELVNTNGDWGYVTIVVTKDQMDKNVWQSFLDDCRRKHLIPIIRIATRYDGKNWEIPKIEEIDNWVNFLNSLNWVIENRYVVIGNEPNHAKEWGGTIDPKGYATYLKTFSERLKNSNKDFFVLPAALDQDAPNSKLTMDEEKYLKEMNKSVPGIFNFIDGLNSHSYPNPGFSGSKTGSGRRSIKGYVWEMAIIKSFGVNEDLPIFITETGWIRNKKNESKISENLIYSFNEVWKKDRNVIAVTPFVLNYIQEPFKGFSFKIDNNSYYPIFYDIKDQNKVKGEPKQLVSGEVVFNFLNPFVFKEKRIQGLTVVRNTGQAIWTKDNSSIKDEFEAKNIDIVSVNLNDIEPFKTGLVVYSLKPNTDGVLLDTKLGFFVLDKKIGDVFKGKIINF